MSRLCLTVATMDEHRPDQTPGILVRPMTTRDLGAAEAVAIAGFVNNVFYRTLLGFDARQFRIYWTRFLPFVLDHPASRAFVLEVDGKPRGILAAGLSGFASPIRGIGFAAGLALRMHPWATNRYLGFVRFYEALMRIPATDRVREARGLWLAVDRKPGDPRLGALLVRGASESLRTEGRTLITGMADGNSPGILGFYRRLGFQLQAPVLFRGRPVVRVVANSGLPK